MLKRVIIPAAAFLVLAAGLPAVFIRINGIEPSSPVLEQAEIARGLARGSGYATAASRPAIFDPGRDPRFQSAYHQPPLYPALLSVVFRAAGAVDRSVFSFSLFWFWLAGLSLALLVRKFFNSSSALLCAVFYFSNAVLLRELSSGSGIFLEIFLLALVLVLYDRINPGWRRCLLLGAVLGLGTLAAPRWWWPAVFILVLGLGEILFPRAAGPGRKRALAGAAALAAGLAAVNLPWLIARWSAARAGLPVFFYPDFKLFTASFPGVSWWREAARIGSSPALKELLVKWRAGSGLIYGDLLFVSGTFLAPFFWLALIVRFREKRRSWLRFAVFFFLLALAAEYVVGARRPENLVLIVPWAIALGSVVFNRLRAALFSSRPVLGASATAVFILINLYPFAAGLRFTRPRTPPPLLLQLHRVGRDLPEDSVIFTDQPWETAWYADRPAIWLPAEIEYLPELAGDRFRSYYLFLTPGSLGFRSPRGRPSWPEVYQGGGYSPFWENLGAAELAGGRLLVRVGFD